MFGVEPARLAAASAVLAGYAALCVHAWWRQPARARRRGAAAGPAADRLLIAFASQSGFGRVLAEHAAGYLRAAGVEVELSALDAIDAGQLARCEQALFIASTSGAGEAPDNASHFAARLMHSPLPLPKLRYGVLALGDRSYAHYCAFGRRLDSWLQASDARPLFPRIEVDRADAQAITYFHHRLASLAGTTALPGIHQAEPGYWRLCRQQLLNPGSAGTRLWRIEFEAVDGPGAQAATIPLPSWEAGDLLELYPPSGAQVARLYSIASLPGTGVLQLLLREVFDEHGKPGLMSALLSAEGALGTVLRARIRPHPDFRLEDNADRPLILIGSGSGLAGVLAHLRQRSGAGDGRNWLIYGERNRAADHHHADELEALARNDLLVRHDLAFSRDAPGHYVQDCLRSASETVRDWIAGGAAIYVCGSATTMGPAVHACLDDILGSHTLAELARQGRYRRDLF